MNQLTVIALGGNALVRWGEAGTFSEQRAHVEASAVPIAACAARGLPLVVTHGNGPVVGQLLLQSELAAEKVPRMPLHVLGAESQGLIGFLLQDALANRLWRAGVGREVATVLTRVVVHAEDPSFRAPSKPIGLFFSSEEAALLMAEQGWVMAEDAGRGWRRRVPSPRPVRIPEARVIANLASRGVVTIAAGGGGVPVTENPDGTLSGVDAVVDKDLASAVLAAQTGAYRLLILTSVDAVYEGWGTPAERSLPSLTVPRARELLEAGEFPSGSMGPKIEAALSFLDGGGSEVRIGLPEDLDEILRGNRGTLLRTE